MHSVRIIIITIHVQLIGSQIFMLYGISTLLLSENTPRLHVHTSLEVAG